MSRASSLLGFLVTFGVILLLSLLWAPKSANFPGGGYEDGNGNWSPDVERNR